MQVERTWVSGRRVSNGGCARWYGNNEGNFANTVVTFGGKIYALGSPRWIR